jgi:CRP/FNR family transcriptional regulator, cyclic AMP receptor protein
LTDTKSWDVQRATALLASQGGWLAHASPDTIQRLIASGTVSTIPAGRQIASHAEPLKEVTIILDGIIRVYSISLDGREHLVSLLEPGAMFGLISCLDGEVSPHEAVADCDIVALVIPVGNLRTMMQDNVDIQQAIVRVICNRLRLAFSVLDQFAIGSPQARLSLRLESLATSYGVKTARGILIDLHLTQDTLAAMIGMSRQRTNMILKTFEAEGMIALDYGRIEILRMDMLSRLGSEAL